METNSLSDVVGLTVVAAKCGSLAGFFDALLGLYLTQRFSVHRRFLDPKSI